MVDEDNTKKIFSKNSINIKNFILRTWNYKFLFFVLAVIFGLITSIYFDYKKADIYSVEYSIKKIDINENKFLINTYNNLIKSTSNHLSLDTATFSPDYFFSLFTRIMAEGNVGEQVIRQLNDFSIGSGQDNRLLVSNELRKITMQSKPLTATEKALFKEGKLDLFYILSFKSQDLDYAESVIKLFIKRVNSEGSKFIKDNLNSMNSYINDQYQLRKESIIQILKNEEIQIRAIIEKRIDYLKYQAAIARELNYEFNQLIYLDEPPFINSRSIAKEQDTNFNNIVSSADLFPTIGSYYDGYKALDQERLELEKLIKNDEEFENYKNNILVNTLINLKKLDDELEIIKKEVLNIQNILDDSSFSLVAYNIDNLLYTKEGKNTNLAIIIAVLFSIFVSYLIIYIRYLFFEDNFKK